ncbi:MAG: hypothetical protein SFY96_06690 [Planctomycetota bacterium]|nr:hypothetical protein [Planctomycetota bacterium]
MSVADAQAAHSHERDLPSPWLSWTRWEFWPWWATYGPIMPLGLMLAARHGSMTLPLIANTHPDLAMLAGESKSRILALIPERWRVPFESIAPGPADARESTARAAIARRGWTFPIVAKPDVGERGSGFRLVRDPTQLAAALKSHAVATILQPFHPGPHEIGLLYARLPNAPRGAIISATTKEFATVLGDGVHTLRDLILAHPRRRLQARVFLARLGTAATRVPAAGEVVALGVAGNHCQGTMFLNGAHLVTPALLDRIDQIAREIPGFHFGRFDIRYSDPLAFSRGEGLAIVELNGIASEPTHIYDPSVPLSHAYRDIFRTLRTVFAIGAANRDAGHRPPTLAEAWQHVQRSVAPRGGSSIAD